MTKQINYMFQRPLKPYTKILNSAKVSKDNSLEKRLILWKFESNLKQCYTEFLRSLEVFNFGILFIIYYYWLF